MDLASARRRADRKAFDYYAEPVTLVIGSAEFETYAIPDHLGRFSSGAPGGRGAVEAQHQDFIFLSDLFPGRPERGSKIRHSSGTYLVLPEGGRSAWEYEPGDHVFIRVHTKLTEQ